MRIAVAALLLGFLVACRALTTLVRGLRRHRVHFCMCPLQIGPGFTIAGRYEQRDVRLHFPRARSAAHPGAWAQRPTCCFPP